MSKRLSHKQAIVAVALVALIVGALAATAAAQSQRFSDVPPTHEAYEAVEWAADVGLTVGREDGTFGPNEALPRWRALIFMGRFYDDVLGADESGAFTSGDMMALLKAINDGASVIPTTTTATVPSDNTAPSLAEQRETQLNDWRRWRHLTESEMLDDCAAQTTDGTLRLVCADRARDRAGWTDHQWEHYRLMIHVAFAASEEECDAVEDDPWWQPEEYGFPTSNLVWQADEYGGFCWFEASS